MFEDCCTVLHSFHQSECCSFGLIAKEPKSHGFCDNLRSSDLDMSPSCFCGINRLFVYSMAKHSLTDFQVHREYEATG